MRNGFKVCDADTHVMPIAEVLELLWDNAARFYKQTSQGTSQ